MTPHVRLSPVPVGPAHRPHTRAFCGHLWRIPQIWDWLAERGEFELPVPICEQSDDSIRLRFATSRRTAKRYRPAAHFSGALGSLGANLMRNPCADASLATR